MEEAPSGPASLGPSVAAFTSSRVLGSLLFLWKRTQPSFSFLEKASTEPLGSRLRSLTANSVEERDGGDKLWEGWTTYKTFKFLEQVFSVNTRGT